MSWRSGVGTELKRLRILSASLITLDVHRDGRGEFVEVWRDSWIAGALTPKQANMSRSKKGVLRGLHYHLRQSDFWFLVEGKALVGLYDFRRSSITKGESQIIELSAERPQGLYIPPGVLHGYYALEDCVLMYLVDQVYDGTDEHGVFWNDSELGLDWPVENPVLSQRDLSNPKLSEVPPEEIPQ
ncbi:MAG: dTDP-4-dehydrorhamnose 3,5-epimerase [Acidimicrobiia bacterium]